MKKLYVFGNEYLEDDSISRKVAEYITDVAVVHCRSPDDLLLIPDPNKEILILDVIKGSTKVVQITDQNAILSRPIMTMHDFDVGYFLHLLKELGQELPVRIIGIPAHGNPEQLAQEVQACI